MINQIQIASEPKDSNLASTLAHETRKNNAGRILFLSLCVVVMLSGAAIFTACGGDDDNKNDSGTFDGNINATVEGWSAFVNSAEIRITGVYAIMETSGFALSVFGSVSNTGFTVDINSLYDSRVLRLITATVNGATVNLSNARWNEAFFYVQNANSETVGLLWRENNNVSVHYVFADREVTITSEDRDGNIWDVSLKPGWNIYYRISNNDSYSMTSQSPSGNLTWNVISMGVKAARELCACSKLIDDEQESCNKAWESAYFNYVGVGFNDDDELNYFFYGGNTFENDFLAELAKCSN